MVTEKRLHTLDYLRGLAAFAIMLYHYLGWSYGSFQADSGMGRIGIYGVALFYVLSGLTLYHVYYHKTNLNIREFKDFFVKRFFRIFPLLWLVMGLSLFMGKDVPDPYKIFLNVTGLFSVMGWDNYIGTGVWSIGNELVFYLFFPIFIFLSKRSISAFYLLCGLLLSLYVYFAFFVLKEHHELSSQWVHYINPLNQVFLFLGGYLIGLWSESWKVPKVFSLALLAFAVLLFLSYPVAGNVINLVTDTTRLAFTGLCFMICLSFYKLEIKLPLLIDKYLKILGEASYALYLLHPIVWFICKMFFVLAAEHLQLPVVPVFFQVMFSVVITLLLSHQVYLRFEKYFMLLGKQVSQRSLLRPHAHK